MALNELRAAVGMTETQFPDGEPVQITQFSGLAEGR